jgi:hypothetical protein
MMQWLKDLMASAPVLPPLPFRGRAGVGAAALELQAAAR